MTLDITVRICSYNRPTYLREALLSVLGQKKRAKFIEIFDNASETAVYDNIKDLLGANISWSPMKTNIGGTLNIQRAFYKVKTKYLYIMHDDDRILPDFLMLQTKFMDEHHDCVAVACNAQYIDKFGRPTTGGWPEPDAKSILYADPRDLALLYAENFLGFPSFIYKSDAIDKMSLRPELGKVSDVGLILDLASLGAIGFQNRKLLEYRIHGEQDSEYFSEKTIKVLYDFLKSFFPRDDKDLKKINTLFRSRLKYTFIINVLRGRSGVREVFWILKLRDITLTFITVTSLVIKLIQSAIRSIPNIKRVQT
jgi:glycosyltransferase involved in cell wall biosynthesis